MSSYYNNFIPWIRKLNFLHFFLNPSPHPKAGSFWNTNRFVCMQKVSWIWICQAFEQPQISDSRNSMFNTPKGPKWLSWRFAYAIKICYFTLRPSKSHFLWWKFILIPPFACVGWNSYLSLSSSRVCHTSKGHHVAHDLASQHTTLNAKRGDMYSLPIKHY